MAIDTTQLTAHTHPGKFEGESPATEYFFNAMLDGDGETIYPSDIEDTDDEDDRYATVFHVDADEAEAFELPAGSVYMIREDSQGFALGSSHPNMGSAQRKLDAWYGVTR